MLNYLPTYLFIYLSIYQCSPLMNFHLNIEITSTSNIFVLSLYITFVY